MKTNQTTGRGFREENFDDTNPKITVANNSENGKNSEVYRKLYRDMGYSLYGYWEINNEDAGEYIPNTK